MSGVAWSIRPYRSGDEAALVELFGRAFNKRITTAHWQWKFRGYDAPFQNVWLAVEGERIIFQYAGIPVRVETEGGPRWAVQSVDTMADPDYRRRGLFGQVARHSYQHWREAGAAFVYGLPNEQSASGFSALGFGTPFSLHWRRHPLRPFAILARRSRINFPTEMLDRLWFALRSSREPRRNFDLAEVLHLDESVDLLWDRYRPDGIAVVRNRDWIRWRYLSAPGLGYRLLIAKGGDGPLGYAAYRLQDGGGMLADVFAADDDVSLALIHGAIDRLRNSGARSIAALAVPGSRFDKLGDQLRFLSGERFKFIVLPLAEDISADQLSDPSAWHLSGGDFDVV